MAVVGGRRTLTSDVDYTVQPAADGSGNVVLLRNADAIIAPLATLARVGPAGASAARSCARTNRTQVAPEQPRQVRPTSEPASAERRSSRR